MKKFFLLAMVSMMTVFAMAVGKNDGSTKANAIDFDWDKGVEHPGGTLWYRVDLAPLYEEENPSMTLYLTNPSNEIGTSVHVSMQATVAGQKGEKEYDIAARKYKTMTANAKSLKAMKQTEIYLTLSSTGKIKLSVKVFEAEDLDEACKDAAVLQWNKEATQNRSLSKWWKIDLLPAKEAVKKDVKITITNIGSGDVELKAIQSLDCPSSGATKRSFTIAAGQSIFDTIPQAMIKNVQPDELYFGIENVEQPVKMLVELIDQPSTPVISETEAFVDLHVEDTIKPLPAKTFYRIKVSEMNSLNKYEPEFTYRNESAAPAKVTVKMAFGVPAFGTSNSVYELGAGEEEIVVYKKNMFEGLGEEVEYIYLLTEVEGDVNFYGRFKHVREGKACKTNIDFNWADGHTQEARTTQWYAVPVDEARDNLQDIEIHIQNLGKSAATVKGSVAFSCPYIDLQEITRTVAKEVSRTLSYSTYAMMSDTVWIGIETSQDIKFWAVQKPTEIKEPDEACLKAIKFDWDEGVMQKAKDTVWYKIAMEEAREKSAKFPTVYVQNMSSSNPVEIKAELSLECPDSIANESRSLKIEANGTYSKRVSRNLFENISQDTIYLRVIATEDVAIQIRLTEEAEGASCASAIPFNWVSGNTQAANANLWYIVDLREVMTDGNDLRLHIENRDNVESKGVAQLSFGCPMDEVPSIQNFKLGKKATKSITVQNSAMDMLEDSVIYVNLQGTTSLHFWAEKLAVEPFDTIYADGIKLDTLRWNVLYTQTQDTAWYIIPTEEIEKVRNLEEKVKPVVHLVNLLGAENSVKAEAAFAFPIGKKMMTKTQKLKANQHFKDTVPAGTFEQFIKKDSLILRVTRPVGGGDFQFQAELVTAFGGNSKFEAIPITLGKSFGQSANTEVWYKVSTPDLKKDKTLYGKSVHVATKNAGKDKTELKVAAFDGLMSEEDLLQERGKRTIKKGEHREHNFPAQAIYAVGDAEIYIRVRTTDSIVFETSFEDYAPLAANEIDTTQFQAKLVVPNVDYVLPADTTMWFRVCAEYFQDNFKYEDISSLYYKLEGDGPATIEVTATLQDTLTYKVPVRKRTINKSGKERENERPLKELLDEAISRRGYSFSIAETQPDYIDSMLHRAVTKEHIAGYIRVRSDKQVTLRLNTKQVKGADNDCLNPMNFDWEHGVVNPKDQLTWYRVTLDKAQIPEEKDVRLHVENWSETATATGTADLLFKVDDGGKLDCSKIPDASIKKSVAPNDEEFKDIARDYLENMGWPESLFIKYLSDQTTYIWLELIDKKQRVQVFDTVNMFLCDGTDTITLSGETHHIDASKPAELQWNDTVELKNAKEAYMYDSIVTYIVTPLVSPAVKAIESLTDQPVIVKGAALDVTAATTALNALFAADTVGKPEVKAIENIFWKFSADGQNFVDLDATPLASARINLKYFAVTECGDTIESAELKNAINDTIEVSACKSYDWEGNTYTESTVDPLPKAAYSHTYLADSTLYLKLTILPPVKATVPDVDACNSYVYTWQVDGKVETFVATKAIVDTIIGGAANGCDSIISFNINISNPVEKRFELRNKFGRILMIHRDTLLDNGWTVNQLPEEAPAGLVTWTVDGKSLDANYNDKGYYISYKNGDPLPAGKYKAVVKTEPDGCGLMAEAELEILTSVPAPAPALMPSLAKPGEDIRVINLDPTQSTTIRIYTTEGLLKNTFTVSGEETFTIKAADEHGFYLVELSNDSMKSTLRYIVK